MAEGTEEISKDDGGGDEKEKKRSLSRARRLERVLNRQPKLYVFKVYDLLCQQKRPPPPLSWKFKSESHDNKQAKQYVTPFLALPEFRLLG